LPMASGSGNETAFWRAEAERLAAENDRLVAQDVARQARVLDLEAQVAALSEKVATLAKLAFGEKSEKSKAEKDPHGATPADGATDAVIPERPKRGQQPGSRGHGRRDYSNLVTEEEVHDVPAEDRGCPECGAQYAPFGEEASEQLDWQVRLVRVIHRRPTYRKTCKCKVRGIVVAPVVPKPIPKGLFTSGFLARLLVEKYVLGRALHRIGTALGHEGLDVSDATLVANIRALSVLLAPLDAAIRARNATAGHLHVDETSWQVFEHVADKSNSRWWLWVFVGVDTTVFEIAKTRSTAVLTEHLGIDVSAGALEAGRRLLISSDFFTVYQSVAQVDGVDPLWCWAHIRRYFIRAADAHKELGPWKSAWIERIGALYLAHRELGAGEAGSEEHARAQVAFAEALGAMDEARKSEGKDESLHPRAHKVLATLDHEWEGLCRHREFPELPLDNNTAERSLRGPVVGRKNYYGCGSVWSAEAAGRIWTTTATAMRAGLNPLSWLTSYLDACARAGGRSPEGTALERFLPWAAGEDDLAAWRDAPGGPGP
jgi:transposase